MNTDFDDPKKPIWTPVDMAGWDPVWHSTTTEDAYAGEASKELEKVPRPSEEGTQQDIGGKDSE